MKPDYVLIEDPRVYMDLKTELKDMDLNVLCGEAALCDSIAEARPDITLSAIVGAAGLRPTMAAIRAGSDIALANKESMVIAGAFMNAAAREEGVQIIPVDSEHNALHQCLKGGRRSEIKRLILTASGGPFRGFQGDFSAITPEQALKHPTWKMGPKITIDSSTLMNKGLEVIEASHLFGFPGEQISVVVHPESVVHSMVEYRDGSILAQMGKTDMCHPVQYALTYPERWDNPFDNMDFTSALTMHFEPVDDARFPCLSLAFRALKKPETLPCVINAANEVAVDAFLARRIPYTRIYETIEETMTRMSEVEIPDFEATLRLDSEARETARMILNV
jgi:1-deoxy-D-xylulose-5-phosphate reductoisomerase